MNWIKPLPGWNSEATWQTFETGTAIQQIGHDSELQKSMPDLERYRAIHAISAPDVVIETGSRDGESARWFRDTLGVEVISIDIDARKRLQSEPGLLFLAGSSTSKSIYRQVVRLIRDRRVMVSLDSDHHARHVWDEISVWGQLVTPGCYLVVEDGCFEQWEPGRARRGGIRIPEEGGPLAAVNRSYLARVDSPFERDIQIEDWHPISHSPGGWWRRG